MTRYLYGAGTGDFTTDAANLPDPFQPVVFWKLRSGGSLETDIVAFVGTSGTQGVMYSDANGQVALFGPEGYRGDLWVSRAVVQTAGQLNLAATGTQSRYRLSGPSTEGVATDESIRTFLGGLAPIALSETATAAVNTRVIQDALAVGGSVLLPPGTFNVEGVVLPATGGFHLRGSGRGDTVLRNTHASKPSISVAGVGPSSYSQDWTLSDLTITSDVVRTGQVGLDVLLSNRFSVRDVTIVRHDVGVRHKTSWECTYNTVSAVDCTTGWLFPEIAPYTVSTPVTVLNGSAVRCGTGVVSRGSVESLSWTGGDLGYCGLGVVLTGNQTRLITLTGVNFEAITGSSVVVGDATSGPTGVNLVGCRFIQPTLDPTYVAVDFVRGGTVALFGSWFANVGTALRQSASSGALTVVGTDAFNATTFLSAGTRTYPAGTYLSTPTRTVDLGANAGGVTSDEDPRPHWARFIGVHGGSGDPFVADGNVAETAGTGRAVRFWARPGTTVTRVAILVHNAGVGTSGQFAVYDSAGAALVPPTGADWNSAGAMHLPVPAFTVPPDGVLYLALLSTGGTTQPSFRRMSNGSSASVNLRNPASPARAISVGTGLTALPATISTAGAESTSPYLALVY